MGDIASSSTEWRARGAICSPGSIAVYGTYPGLWVGHTSGSPLQEGLGQATRCETESLVPDSYFRLFFVPVAGNLRNLRVSSIEISKLKCPSDCLSYV